MRKTEQAVERPRHLVAVDYAQFGEQNPYGYGVCVGARYLLFPKAEASTYSYSQGRRPPP